MNWGLFCRLWLRDFWESCRFLLTVLAIFTALGSYSLLMVKVIQKFGTAGLVGSFFGTVLLFIIAIATTNAYQAARGRGCKKS